MLQLDIEMNKFEIIYLINELRLIQNQCIFYIYVAVNFLFQLVRFFSN